MKEYRCKGCKKVIALMDDHHLYSGGMAIPFRINFSCLHCGYHCFWRPIIKKNGNNGMSVESPLSIDALAEVVGGN